jgi:hypothetical protein
MVTNGSVRELQKNKKCRKILPISERNTLEMRNAKKGKI